MADVFLSYAREDRARAEQVANGLAAAGVDVFWDNEIPPGQTWADYIETKLTECKALIVLWSEHSTKSQWVREEARLGRDKGVLIPAMIDGAQAPFGFGEVQAANLADWRGEPEHPGWRRFVDAVLAASARAAPPARPVQSMTPARDPAPAPSAASSSTTKRGVPIWAWAAGAVGALGLVSVAVMLAQSGDKPAEPPAGVTQMGPATTDAAPAESPQAIILTQLQQAQMALAQQGFQLVGQPYSGGLAQGETWNVPAQLMVGFEYRLLGVCDRDCADLDLVLFDAAGAPVAQDTTTTSQPIIALRPGYSGGYTVQVLMYNCTVAPCYYAVALYGRPVQ